MGTETQKQITISNERRALTDLVRAQRDPSKSEEERRALLDMFYSGDVGDDMSMENSDHTPGPWTICYWGDGGARYIGPDNTQWVAQIAEDNILEDIRLANARLIAAAPDLLEALKKAEAALAIASSYVNMEQRYMRSSLESIRDAIAKAKS